MFSSTAYEAYYTYIGMYLHQTSIQIISSHTVLFAILTLILGITLFLGIWKYFSKYFPPSFGCGPSVGPGYFIKLLVCFVLGISLLRLGSESEVKNYNNDSWHNNPYVASRTLVVNEKYKVSFIFDLLTRTAEEIAAYASKVVDELFASSNSELEAPAAFYKAILFAGSQTIDDLDLRDKIDVYTDSCFEQVLPLISLAARQDKIDVFFNADGVIDRELKEIEITKDDGTKQNCLDLKNSLRRQLHSYAGEKGAPFWKAYRGKYNFYNTEDSILQEYNLIASSTLVNHYMSQSESLLGEQKGSEVRGTLANFLRGWNQLTSWDGVLSLFGKKNQVGAVLTAERAEKFSEYLQRAPHLKGMVKMFLILIFPWLVFFVIAGRWKILVAWFALYCSVLLWTPLWILLYHLMTSIAVSTDLMLEWGRISDGISLYSASFITTKIYQFYAIYSWLQLIVGPLPTMILAYGCFAGILNDSQTENTPQVVSDAKDIGLGAATGGASGTASALVRKI
ncbi:MAG: hypothetical protein AB8G05_05760 [Oligoflexales bacterium]